jgi:hypothetical protein
MRRPLALLGLALATAFLAGIGPRDDLRVRNLGLAGSGGCCTGIVAASERLFAFAVPEREQGGRDLNGDGDAEDAVAHVHDIRRGVTRNLGIAGWHFMASGRFAVFYASEGQQGRDLSSDGDTDDRVVQLYDAATGAVFNTGVSLGLHGEYQIHGPYVAVKLDPPQFGDIVLIDARDRSRKVIAARASSFALGDGVLAWAGLSGPEHHRYSLHVYDFELGTDFDLELPIDSQAPALQVGDHLVLFRVLEFFQGVDLNGDGDLGDGVFHAYDARTRAVHNLGLAGRSPHPQDRPEAQVAGRLVALRVSELEQGADLDGDGVRDDMVLHRFDIERQTAPVNLGQSAFQFAVSPRRIAFLGLEGTLWVVRDAVPIKVARNVSFLGFALTDAMLAFAIEEGQVGPDLNGDGEMGDRVAHTFDIERGRTRNLRLATWYHPLLDERTVLWRADENSQGTDLNGDGHLNGSVAFVHRRNLTHNLRLVNHGASALTSGWGVFTAEEYSEGDLNGDGDASDSVLHLVRTKQ